MNITTIGIDLAKPVFQLHGIDNQGQVMLRRTLSRGQMAICEAVTRPNMRFVPVKTTEQQALLMVHRIRERVKSERTALINQIRGLLALEGIGSLTATALVATVGDATVFILSENCMRT